MVRMRTTKGKRNQRRAHHTSAISTLTQEAGVMRIRHRASRLTGMFRGKKVMEIAIKEKKGHNDAEKKTTEEVTIPAVEQ